MFATAARSSAHIPTNRNLPMKLKSRFVVEATAAIAKKITDKTGFKADPSKAAAGKS